MPRALCAHVLSLLGTAAALAAQGQFSHLQKQHLPDVSGGIASMLWLDADGDNDLDLLAIGQTSQLLLRAGPLQFTAANAGIPGSARHRAAALGDLDGDGDLDVVIARESDDWIYRNSGNGTFADATSQSLAFVVDDTRAVALGDGDGDGDLDIVFGNVNAADRLLLNDGTGRFTAAPANALPPGAGTAALAMFDADGDGDLDLVRGGATATTELLLNNNGVFTASAGALPGATANTVSITAADLEGDGDIDLLIGKVTGSCHLLLNNGNGTFVDASARLPANLPAPQRTLLLDIDGDRDLDIAWTSLFGTILLRNDGAAFADIRSQLPLVDGIGFQLSAEDADGDGDADLFVASGRLMLWVNDGGRFFDASGAPIALVQPCCRLADIDGDGDLDLLTAPTTDPAAGCVHVNDGRGAFADQTAARWNPTGAARTQYAFAVGDVDGDGDADIALGQIGQDRLFLNDGTGHFAEATATHLPLDQDATTSLALADVDGDGDLDLVLANARQPNRLCRNDGAGHFTTAAGFLPNDAFWTQGVAAADVDGDGDRDLLFADWNTTAGSLVRLYRNDGTGRFANAIALPPGADYDGGFAVADIDGDGDLDFAALGVLYINDGSGTFADQTAARTPRAPGLEPCFVDLDLDGDLDLISYQALLLNDGTGNFIDGGARFAGSGFFGAVPRPYAVGDVDRDGDPDVVGSYALFENLHQHLAIPRLPVLGGRLQLDVYATPGYGALPQLAVTMLATGVRPVVMPFWGILHLDLAAVLSTNADLVPTSTGRISLTGSVPNTVALAGRRIHAQALVLHGQDSAGWRFTNVATETIVR